MAEEQKRRKSSTGPCVVHKNGKQKCKRKRISKKARFPNNFEEFASKLHENLAAVFLHHN